MKLLAAVVLSFTVMGNPTISLTPDAPIQGGNLTITYSGGTNPQTLTIEWVPTGSGPTSVTTDANGVATVKIPADAESVTVSGGGAPAAVAFIDDPST